MEANIFRKILTFIIGLIKNIVILLGVFSLLNILLFQFFYDRGYDNWITIIHITSTALIILIWKLRDIKRSLKNDKN